MKRKYYPKAALLLISILLLSTIGPALTGTETQRQQGQKNRKQEIQPTITVQTYGLPGEPTKQTDISPQQAHYLYSLLQDLHHALQTKTKQSDLQKIQTELLTYSHNNKMLPAGITQNTLNALPIAQLPYDQRNRPPLHLPANRASQIICNFASTGAGSALPVIIFPRLIPVLLTPIPRLFLKWNTYEGVTSCGGMLTGTGFIASGQQQGLALGFWGIGFSVFLPPLMAYGILGYALFATVTAEEIEPWPLNRPPEVTPIYPLDEAINIPIQTTELEFYLSDFNADPLSYQITTHPDIGTAADNNVTEGTFTVPISSLEGSENYQWTAHVSDGIDITEQTFSFTTEMVAPIVSNPHPSDEERYVPIGLDELTFSISDPQNDPMDYTVETSPDIGSASRNQVNGGTFTLDITGLENTKRYTWYINVTDGEHWKHKTYTFQTEPRTIFNPFDEGWTYRKQITIDHSKVVGDLKNFPILIKTTDTDLQAHTQTNGEDILFMNNTGIAHRQYHEIEQYNSNTGELICWVNISTIDAEENTSFYLYYGNPTCESQHFWEKTWDDYYVGVWHLNEQSGNAKDSTATKDGVVIGSPSYYQSFEKIHKSIYFDGSNLEYFDIIDDTYLFNDEDVTLETWVYFTEYRNYYETPLTFGDTDNYPGLSIDRVRSGHAPPRDGKIITGERFDPDGSGYNDAESDVGGSTHTDQWHFIVGRFERGIETSQYLNGIKQQKVDDCENNDLSTATNFQARIGTGSKTFNYHPPSMIGYIDEVRVSKGIARSPSWIQTEYNNQQNPTDFTLFGPEEST